LLDSLEALRGVMKSRRKNAISQSEIGIENS
jgi:hypothetical protein